MALIEALQRVRNRHADRVGRVHALTVAEADPRRVEHGIRLGAPQNPSGLTSVAELHLLGVR